MVYNYTCCSGNNQTISSYNNYDYVCAQNGYINMYTGGSYTNWYTSCTGC